MQLAWSNILQSLGMTAEEVWRERSQFQGLELSGESSTSVLSKFGSVGKRGQGASYA